MLWSSVLLPSSMAAIAMPSDACPTPAGKGPQKCHPFGLRLRSVSFDSQSGSRWGRWPSGHLRQRCQGWRCKMMQRSKRLQSWHWNLNPHQLPSTSNWALCSSFFQHFSPRIGGMATCDHSLRWFETSQAFEASVWKTWDTQRVWDVFLVSRDSPNQRPTKKRTCPAGVFLMVLKELPSSDGTLTWEHHGTGAAKKDLNEWLTLMKTREMKRTSCSLCTSDLGAHKHRLDNQNPMTFVCQH